MMRGKINARIAAAAVFASLLLVSAANGGAGAAASVEGASTAHLPMAASAPMTAAYAGHAQTPKAAAVDAAADDDKAVAKLGDSNAAIKQAKALGLLPEHASVTSAKLADGKWAIDYTVKEKESAGTILLNAETGLSVRFSESLGKVAVYEDNVPLVFLGEEKIDYPRAAAIAEAYAQDRYWDIEADWIPWRYPVNVYSLRYETGVYHRVEFVRSYEGIRYDNNRFIVYVDRESGEIVAHFINWTDTRFHHAEGTITLEKAAATFYRDVEPFLQRSFWWSGEGEQPLEYATYPVYTMNAKGELPGEYNSDVPMANKGHVGSYPRDLAKKRLLSLYDLEPVYLDESPGQASLYYQLRIKPGVPVVFTGEHPFIHAHNGEWLGFGEASLTGDLPSASAWLIGAAVPEGAVDYKAAVIWNNELLSLRDEPVIRNDSTLLPFRELLEKLGASIQWDPATRKVTANKDGVRVELTIGSGSALVNGKPQPIGAPATIVNGRTYIPARLVLEALGAKVGWNEGSRLVLVDTGEVADLPALSALAIGQLRFAAQINWEEKHAR